eukprot:6625483-Prymnesium_polylepis.1
MRAVGGVAACDRRVAWLHARGAWRGCMHAVRGVAACARRVAWLHARGGWRGRASFAVERRHFPVT